MKKPLLCVLGNLVIAAIFIPFSAFALVTAASQTATDANANADVSFQPLGNSLVGTFTQLDLIGADTISSTSTVSVTWLSCTDSTYSSCSDLTLGHPWQVKMNPNTGQTVISASSTAGITLTSGTYSGFALDVTQQGLSPLYGSSATSSLPIAGTAAFHTVSTYPCTNCSVPTATRTVKQLYFVLYYGSNQIPWNSVYFPLVYSSTSQAIATSSGLWQSLELASSTQSCATGNFFSNAI